MHGYYYRNYYRCRCKQINLTLLAGIAFNKSEQELLAIKQGKQVSGGRAS
jgi:hypothetical protein